MSDIQLLKSLLLDLDSLPSRDEHKLDALTRRTEMIIRKLFGEDSKYLKDLKSINFFPMVYPADEAYYNESWLSGVNRFLNLLKTMIEEKTLFSESNLSDEDDGENREISDTVSSKKVFIVHGHDGEMKQSVARVIEKLSLEPIILHEQPNKGRTIIEKFVDYSDVDFAIVLLSPDDLVYDSENGSNTKEKSRARQNVVFELGYFIGKLGREKVLALYKPEDGFELPSDYSGVLYVPYQSDGAWAFAVVKELNACGYTVDANVLLK